MKFMFYIMECSQTVNYSIMINGEFTKPFDAAEWLRQGGHFAFLICYTYDVLE